MPGRHRAPRKKRLPRALTPTFALPSVAAATLVLTTTGATMAGSAPIEVQTATIDLALAQSQVSESRSDTAALAERRTEITDQTSLLQGRQQEADRIARENERLALEAKQKAEAEKKASRAWVFPIATGRYTSGYGMRWGRMHNGIDFAAPIGTPVYSVSSGTVLRMSSAGGCGRHLFVEHWDGTVTKYCHLDYFSVSEGERVGSGQKLGGSGNTGRSTGPHLHFEVLPNGIDGGTINPHQWLQANGLL